MRLIAILTVVIGCLTSVSCSTKIAYNFLDWAIEWKVKRLVPLHGPQKDVLKDAANRFHYWHRTTQLPQYANYLTDLANRIDSGPLSAQDIHAETDKIQILMDQSLEQALPDIAKLMSDLDDKQASQLIANVQEETEEYIDDYVNISVKKKIKKRYKDFEDYFEPWVGSITTEQENLISQWTEALEPYEELNVKQQEIWQRRLQATLQARQNPQALDNGLRGLMFYRTDDWLPELEKVMDHNQSLTYQLIEDLLTKLTVKQKQHLLNELHEYARICRELAAKD